MRQNATFLLAIFLIVSSGGCSQFQKQPVTVQPNLGSVDAYAMPTEAPSYPADSYNTYEAATDTQSSTNLLATPTTTFGAQPVANTGYPAGSSRPRYHTVSKNDTLFGLARMYYGDQRRWRDIYQANRNEILDPNMIRVGQRLLVP